MTPKDLTELTPLEKRARIAVLCGWEDCKTADLIGRKITKTIVATNDEQRAAGDRREKRGLPNWPYVEVPDYLNDLNAMHKAQETCLTTDALKQSYMNEIWYVVGNQDGSMNRVADPVLLEFMWAAFTPTASQRADALLLALQ